MADVAAVHAAHDRVGTESYTDPLVVKARQGDPAALQELAHRELPRVERLLGRLLGPRNDMEDLVQNVFLEMCRALPGFREQSALSTFVGGIAVRVARRAMRPTAWQRYRSPMPEDPPVARSAPDRDLETAERLRRLDAALAKLTQPKREAFVLWAVEGVDVREVATLTGASLAATRSRIFYAQRELKALASRDPYLRELLPVARGGGEQE